MKFRKKNGFENYDMWLPLNILEVADILQRDTVKRQALIDYWQLLTITVTHNKYQVSFIHNNWLCGHDYVLQTVMTLVKYMHDKHDRVATK